MSSIPSAVSPTKSYPEWSANRQSWNPERVEVGVRQGNRKGRAVRQSLNTHAFAPRFFQIPPHGDTLALRYHFTSIRS